MGNTPSNEQHLLLRNPEDDGKQGEATGVTTAFTGTGHTVASPKERVSETEHPADDPKVTSPRAAMRAAVLRRFQLDFNASGDSSGAPDTAEKKCATEQNETQPNGLRPSETGENSVPNILKPTIDDSPHKKVIGSAGVNDLLDYRSEDKRKPSSIENRIQFDSKNSETPSPPLSKRRNTDLNSSLSPEVLVGMIGITSANGTDSAGADSAANNAADSVADSAAGADSTAAGQQRLRAASAGSVQGSSDEDFLCQYFFSIAHEGVIEKSSAAGLPIASEFSLYRVGTAVELKNSEGPNGKVAEPFLFIDVEGIVTRVLAGFLLAHPALGLLWAAETFRRLNESTMACNPAVIRRFRRLSLEEEKLTELRDIVCRFVALMLTVPAYFELVGVDTTSVSLNAGKALAELLREPQSGAGQQFYSKVFDEMVNNDVQTFKDIMKGCFEALFLDPLANRSMTQPCSAVLTNLLSVLGSSYIAAQVLRSLPLFEAVAAAAPASLKGRAYEENTFLGRCFCVTPIDEVTFSVKTPAAIPAAPSSQLAQAMATLMAGVQQQQQSTRERLFSQCFQKPAAVLQSVLALRRDTSEYIEQATNLVAALCRREGRTVTLPWFANLITLNAKRSQQMTVYAFNALGEAPSVHEMLLLTTSGLSRDAFNCNVFWGLLKLLEPVKCKKANELNAQYLLTAEAARLLPTYFTEARLGGSDLLKKEQDALLNLERADASGSSGVAKFPTQVFWLTAAALRYMFLPILRRYEALLEQFDKVVDAIRQNPGDMQVQQKADLILGRMLCWNGVIHNRDFLNALGHFLTLAYHMVFHLALGNIEGIQKENNLNRGAIEDIVNEMAAESCSMTASLGVVPSALMEDICATVITYTRLTVPAETNRRSIVSQSMPTFTQLNIHPETPTTFALFIMRNTGTFTSPHFRQSCGAEVLATLLFHPTVSKDLDAYASVRRNLVSTVVFAFLDSQSSGYYERIGTRSTYTRLLEKYLKVDDFRRRLVDFPVECGKDKFVRFLAMFVENMTWLLEEAVSTLAEIKSRTTGPGAVNQNRLSSRHTGTGTSRPPQTTTAEGENEEDDFDTRAVEEGHNVQNIPLDQLEKLCSSLMVDALRSVKVAGRIIQTCGTWTVTDPLLLPQIITSLDCALEHLVGPRCLQLKVTNFQRYNFDPRALLAAVCEIYNHLLRESETVNAEDKVLTAICNDARYFKLAVFIKAVKITRREGILNVKEWNTFCALTEKLHQKAAEVESEEHWLSTIWDDVPDDFKDPIMDDLMIDPVRLPTSNHVMDRRHIERHLMTEGFDPFNRLPLTKDALEPQEELKKRIEDFLRDKRLEQSKISAEPPLSEKNVDV